MAAFSALLLSLCFTFFETLSDFEKVQLNKIYIGNFVKKLHCVLL